MAFTSEFEDETGIHENYDPDGDRESGYLSTAWWKKYANFLEGKLKAAQKNGETEPSTSHNKAMSAISFRAEKLISKVKNGMASSTIHDIRDILAAVAETAS